jgi:inner membrane protein
MEPITHFLTGAVIARTGFNRRAAYATFAMVIAAEFPDIDTIGGWFGPLTGFQHHRGITHTFTALPVEAALITAYFYFTHKIRKRSAKAQKAPHNWAWLYGGVLVALLSHLLLDWTNNYGIRLFFPFNPRWYAGSFVFIFEPVMFLLLLGALILPSLFALINSEVGARRKPFIGCAWAIAALVGIAALYILRFNQHTSAIQIARINAPADATRIFASPYPVNPFRWAAVADSPASLQLLTIDSRTGLAEPSIPADTLYKPAETPALEAAKQTRLGRVYLDWSSFPVISESADNSDPNHPLTRITFSDARFMYDTILFHGGPDAGSAPPLSGSVLLNMSAPPPDRVVETRMGDRIQR